MKKIIAAVLILAMVFSFAACGKPASKDDDQPRKVTDFHGNEIEVPAKVTNIVTGKTVCTNLVIIVGGTEVLGCLGEGFNYKDGNLCKDMFPGLDDLQELKDNAMNAEELLALNPDVVLISSPSPEGNEVGETLKASGINVAYYNLGTVDDLLKTVNMIADIIGTEEARANAQKYIDFLNKAMTDTKAVAAKAGKSVKTAYSRGTRGICGANSMPGIWMSELGAENIGETLDIKGFMAEVTAEDLLNQNPDVIFCESPQAQELFKDEKFAGLKAVQNGQVPVVPYGLACSGLATADNPIVWYFAANYLYPETANFDVEGIMKDFYKTFYNYELSQAQLDAAFHK